MARKRGGIFNIFRLPSMPDFGLEADTKKSIFIIFIITLGAICLLGLFGGAGQFGDYLKQYLKLAFGWGSPIFPLSLIVWGYFLYSEEKYEVRGGNYLGAILFLLSFHTLLFLAIDHSQWQTAIIQGQGGGYVGLILADNLYRYTGLLASWLIAFCLLITSILLIFKAGLKNLIGREGLVGKMFYPVAFLASKLSRKDRSSVAADEAEDENAEENEDEEEPALADARVGKGDEEEGLEDEEEPDEDEQKEETEPEGMPVFVKSKINDEDADIWWKKKTSIKINLPLDLLNEQTGKPKTGDIEANKEIIKRTMENFGIPVEMGEVNVGPTVTQYTFKPAEGIKLSRIAILGNDLALALALHPIRIEAPIPNRSLVGLEVPNKAKASVSLKEVLASDAYKSRDSNLMIALGKDVRAVNRVDNLGRMPHLLVAGATNTGKSVFLNSIIVSLIYQNDPDDIKFILVDPKRVELSLYNGIPYLLTPVITGVKETINALRWCLNEMEKRFDILKDKGVKNISTYNDRNKIKMPYIVFIIDELADLMVAAGRDVEAGVTRLSQMARAVGIHLILATQRPSVDIITGVIKANMNARAAFTVASGVDSKTILDHFGSEKLLGRGDMLYKNAEMTKPIRIQGPIITESEIKKIVRYIKDRSSGFEFIQGVTDRQNVRGSGGFGLDKSGNDSDEMYEEAKELIINYSKASTTWLQRKLRIGYSRAASLLDALEENGVVSAAMGNNKGREVLITREQYAAMTGMSVSGAALHKREEAVAPDEYLEDEHESSSSAEVIEDDGEDNGHEDEVEDEVAEESEGHEGKGDEDEAEDDQESVEEENNKGEDEGEINDASAEIFEIKPEDDSKNKNIRKPIENFEDKLFSR